MADIKLSQLTTIAAANVTSTDRFLLTDTSAAQSKALEVGEAQKAIFSVSGTQYLTLTSSAFTSTVPFVIPAGTAGAPGLALTGDLDTGIHGTGTANELGINAGGGTVKLILTTTSLKPGSDNVVALGTASARFSDVRSVVINTGDLGLKDLTGATTAHWVLREGVGVLYAYDVHAGLKYTLAMQGEPMTDDDRALIARHREAV